jgi:hypothetical protein
VQFEIFSRIDKTLEGRQFECGEWSVPGVVERSNEGDEAVVWGGQSI